MEWDASEGRSDDVIDRRGAGGGGGGLGGLGGGFPIPMGRRGGGVLGIVVALLAAFVLPGLLGGSGVEITNDGMNQLPGVSSGPAVGAGDPADASIPADRDPDPRRTEFANVVITDTNNMWEDVFAASGRRYARTKMVLYSGGVQSGCGAASSAMGPFYCPADKLVYIDLSFFEELADRFGAAGDFAQAYVIAHEVGHHVQDEMGVTAQVRRLEQDDPSRGSGPDGLSVRTELQADCLAGVWAHSRYERGQSDPTKRLDDGDIDEALQAASGVGDDSIQRSMTGSVRPESFTHGTSAQRKRWFGIGYDKGDAGACDTFNAGSL
ncbi:MAG: neutral zinc metallopeptidase [Microthrixaceae bacterium]